MCGYTVLSDSLPEMFKGSDGRNGRTVNNVTTVIQHMKINTNLPNLQNGGNDQLAWDSYFDS